MFETILQAIKNAPRIIIHRHSRPDGDALGSQIGLKHIILENFPEKEVYIVGDAPGFFSFMEGAVMDEISDSCYADALATILDSGSRSMISDPRYALAKQTVRFDHHIFCEKIADIEVIDTSFESCCGLITAFTEESALRLNPLSAKALYTGMVTDSGRFRYDSTSARTFHLASLLMAQPFDTNDLFCDLYADDYASKLMKAQFILKIKFTANRVAYIYTTAEELAALNKDVLPLAAAW